MTALRQLDIKDAPLMLEWMHDPEIQKGFMKDMSSITLEQAEKFCLDSALPDKIRSGCSLNYAITDDSDEYLGTISLKKIDLSNKTAEYAVSTRKKVHNQAVAQEATKLLLKKAFEEFELHRVYLYVLADNIRAIKFYEKCGFIYEGKMRDHLLISGKYMDWMIYGILSDEFTD